MYRRQFLTSTAAATAGIVSVSSRAAKASAPESAYTTESVCLRHEPGGASKGVVTEYTGGYVVGGPVSDGGFTWWQLSFNEDDARDYSYCLGGTDGTVTGWVEDGVLASADFAHPVTGTVLREWQEYEHRELDVAADAGRSVHAADGGTVVTAESSEDSRCGRHVVVDHGAGWTTRYCHLRDVSVSEGQSVTKGTEIGTVGSTGDAFQPHVAFQIRRDGDSRPIPGVQGHQLLTGAGVPRNYR